tara:strand:+ start:623 stop:892 length:270 start_codon:yes stop_codon:yes gene_type:complete
MSSAAKKVSGGLGFDLLEDAVGTGRSSAERAQKKQAKMIAEQQKKQDQLLAEGESDVKRRQALATKGKAGRKSLIATAETGLPSNLGGV